MKVLFAKITIEAMVGDRVNE